MSKISLNSKHAAAVGALGHLYVWGQNTTSSSTTESGGALGILDSEVSLVERPLYFRLQNSLYSLRVDHVACGPSFTAVVATENSPEYSSDTLNTNEDCCTELSDYEKLINELKRPLSDLKPEQTDLVTLVIKESLESYLESREMKFSDLFKSNVIKQETFVHIINVVLQIDIHPFNLDKYFGMMEMRCPGHKIKISKVYQTLYNYNEGKGCLYLLGESMFPQKNSVFQGEVVKDGVLSYLKVSLMSKEKERLTAKKVCCGEDFVVVLASNEKVYTWGKKGSLGLGGPRRFNYEKINELELESIVDVVCGGSHCLALRKGGLVYSWGRGDSGRLGHGHSIESVRPQTVSLNNAKVSKIVAGPKNSACICENNEVYFWGEVFWMQFGPQKSKQVYEKPESVKLEFGVTDITLGEKHNLYLTKNKTLVMMGAEGVEFLENEFEQFEGVEFTEVACFRDSFFALAQNGTLYTWSKHSEDPGNLGRLVDEAHPLSVPLEVSSQEFYQSKDSKGPEEVKFQKSSQATAIFCGSENTLLLTNSGEVLISGSNRFGQLGIAHGDVESDVSSEDPFGEDYEYQTFQYISRLSLANNLKVEKVSCGTFHILAIDTQKNAYAWGSNSHGQLGLNHFIPEVHLPTLIEELEECSEVSAGNSHSLVVSGPENSVFAFGSAENGKLGIGRVKPSTMVNYPCLIEDLKGIAKVSCGGNHSLALSKEGSLYTWGRAWEGQLGHGTREDQNSPKLFSGSVGWSDGVCGLNHTVCLSESKVVYHTGCVCTNDQEDYLKRLKKVPGLEKIPMSLIAAGEDLSMCVTENKGTVYSWGRNAHCKVLSRKKLKEDTFANPVSTVLANNEKVASISAGKDHAGLVTSEGSVYTWGSGTAGCLGDPSFNNKNKNFEEIPVDLKHVLVEPEKDLDLQENLTLQELLCSEPEEMQERVLKENDQVIFKDFTECVNKFLDLAELDKAQEDFFARVKHKTLNRVINHPFDCKIVSEKQFINQHLKERVFGYSALLTIFQMHCCYVYNLMELNIQQEKKLEFLELLYCQIEGDKRLICSAVYLSQMLLKKILSRKVSKEGSGLDFLQNSLYKEVVQKVIAASEEDMEIVREFAQQCISNMNNVISDDPNGINQDPKVGLKGESAQNEITAYALNRNLVDRRMLKLRQILELISISVKNLFAKQKFSNALSNVVQNLVEECRKNSLWEFKKFEAGRQDSDEVMHAILNLVFEVVEKAIKDPWKYSVYAEINISEHTNNLASLSETVKNFFSGRVFEKPWSKELDLLILSQESIETKVDLLKNFLEEREPLEEEALVELFNHSLLAVDKEVTVNVKSLLRLHSCVKQNVEKLRVNNPSYDPLYLILDSLESVPPIKEFHNSDNVNLTLMTRGLRQEQNLAKCSTCTMLVPREMAPNNFLPVIELFDPIPPGSAMSLLSKVLKDGPFKTSKTKIQDYLKNYQHVNEYYLKEFEKTENVKGLLYSINTEISAEMSKNIQDDLDTQDIDKIRERKLKTLEEKCFLEYYKRKHHLEKQVKLQETFRKLYETLRLKEANSNLSEELKKRILFDVEYGASNRELEKYSDSVSFSITMNKIREYTAGKPKSVELFENLKKDMKDDLRGYAKKPLKELVKRGVVESFQLPGIKVSCVHLSLEVEEESALVILVNSPKKFNICGRDEFREEQILVYERLPFEKIAQIREDVQLQNLNGEGESRSLSIPEGKSNYKVTFSKQKLLFYLAKIEEEVAAYIQNFHLNEEEKDS